LNSRAHHRSWQGALAWSFCVALEAVTRPLAKEQRNVNPMLYVTTPIIRWTKKKHLEDVLQM
jgi:hypothetical protein